MTQPVDVESGGEPQIFVRCTSCGRVYTGQETDAGKLRPIGTGGGCRCGHTEFSTVATE